MLCRYLFSYLKAFLSLQIAFYSVYICQSQVIQPEIFSATTKQDMVYDMYQLNDSLLINILSNTPTSISTNFALSQDSVINTILFLNIQTKQIK